MVLGMMLPTLAATVPSTSGLKRLRSPSQSPVSYRSRMYHTPSRTSASSRSIHNPFSNDDASNITDNTINVNNIDACLAELAIEGTDFTDYALALFELDLTPDVIPDADDTLLVDLLGGSSIATLGKILKLKQFCRRWVVRCSKQRDLFSLA